MTKLSIRSFQTNNRMTKDVAIHECKWLLDNIDTDTLSEDIVAGIATATFRLNYLLGESRHNFMKRAKVSMVKMYGPEEAKDILEELNN